MPIGANTRIPNSAAQTRICVDRYRDGQMEGRIVSAHSKDPIAFAGVEQLAERMDALFDQLSFPMASFTKRSFRTGTETATLKKRGGAALDGG